MVDRLDRLPLAERCDAIEDLLAQRGGVMRMRDIPVAWGSGSYDRGRDVIALVRSGRVVSRRHLGETYLATRVELLPEGDEDEVSGVHRLPMLERGFGDRRDECVRYDGCLSRFVAANPTAPGAQCPPACTDFGHMPAHVRLGLVAPYSRPGDR